VVGCRAGELLHLAWSAGGAAASRHRRGRRPLRDQVIEYRAVLYRDFVKISVADPDPNPDPYFLGLLDPDPLVRGMDPDPSIIKQKL